MSLDHPQKEQLIAFGQGKLAVDESSSVEQHLEVCRECCETLLDLKDDTFVGLVKIAKPSGSDRRVDTLARPATATGKTESDRAKMGGSAHPTDSEHSATLLMQSGEAVSIDELPAELRDHPRYHIVELIGRGGMGNVYRAEHRLMNRPVAIKLINSQLIQQPQAVERFRREVQAAAKLTHPNIVTAYDAEQAGDVHYLVMEFVEGTDLASVVKHRGPLSVAEACECIRQVAEGLQHAHESGMVHRDIKPHNLMLSANGQVRILDFGLAGFASEAAFEGSHVRQNVGDTHVAPQSGDSDYIAPPSGDGGYTVTAAHLTTAGSVMGTPDYIAPEQAVDAHSADIRADIYSLGCTLHFLLTGKPPFEADNVFAKLKAHAQQPPPSLTTLRKDVPVELAKVAARMMAKNPAERFQTPAAVAEALAPFAEPSATPPRRRIGRAIAAAFLFPAMILAAVIIYMQTDTGQFEIQATNEVAVLIEQSKLKIRDKVTGRDYQLTAGKHSIRKGEYVINVTELPDGLTVDTDQFSLTRGGAKQVTVTFKPQIENATVTDEPRLQGKWIAVSGHARKKPLTAAELSQLSISFDGERVEFVSHTGPPTPQAVTFTINSKRDPKQIDFVAPGKQESMPGIYQFDGDRLKLALIDQDYSRPTNFDPDHRPDHLTAVFERVTVAATLGDEERKVLKAAEAFLAAADEGNFDKLYDMGSNLARKQVKREQVVPLYQQIRDTAGRVERRTLRRVRLIDEFLGLPPGRYAAVQYASDFEKHKGLWETVMLNVDDDGQWRANTYAATVQPLPLPEPKKKPQSGAEIKVPQPRPQGPAPAMPLGKNLITDPSLEETAIGQKYPQGWGTGNVNPPDSFKHRVAEGGRTGQRGWLIEGDGQFAVIPTNRPPAHPAYRYAATAWVRIESGSAQIKLLYFDNQGQYIGENRGNVSIQQDGWHKLTMVDDLKSYPEARSLSLALTMTGPGKAVFDDLELLAFDASKLPEKFEATYGAASHHADVFDRWVGRWESTTTYAPTAATPEERVIKGETIVRKVLGDRFLLWQWSSDDGQSQYLTLLCFNDNTQAYHIWLFGSGGEVFDRTGQWNAASQTLTLQVKPSSPGVTGMSTDRFVSQDRIESTLLVKVSGGQVTRDMRATWIRKSKTVEGEIALADGSRADVSELAVLQKMVGRWSVRQTIKPCIAFPNGDQATGTEHNAWVLGGRFFLNRAYDDQQRLTSLALQTYDPVEKTYQHWHFAKDVFGGQWRITWDASSRAFHWRSIDMPPGWIGTGFNRWINDDTFDNQALIKDENGRTVFDSHQDKRRKK